MDMFILRPLSTGKFRKCTSFKPYLLLAALVLAGCTPKSDLRDEQALACDCETVVLSAEEVEAGCTTAVKERACPLFREVMRERLPQNRNQRELERRMEPKF